MERILIANNYDVVRKGLKQIITEAIPTAEIDETVDLSAMLTALHHQNCNLVIADISIAGGNGFEILKEIRKSYPALPVLIFTMHPEDHYAIRALKAGASGYLNVETGKVELVNAVRCLLEGKKYIPPEIAEQLAGSLNADTGPNPHERLSNREFEVLKFIAAGNSIGEASGRLGINASTVSTYRTRILGKLRLKTNADLTLFARENNIL